MLNSYAIELLKGSSDQPRPAGYQSRVPTMASRPLKMSQRQALAVFEYIGECQSTASAAVAPNWWCLHSLMRAAQESEECLRELAPQVASAEGTYVMRDVLTSRWKEHDPHFRQLTVTASAASELIQAWPRSYQKLKTQAKAVQQVRNGGRQTAAAAEEAAADASTVGTDLQPLAGSSATASASALAGLVEHSPTAGVESSQGRQRHAAARAARAPTAVKPAGRGSKGGAAKPSQAVGSQAVSGEGQEAGCQGRGRKGPGGPVGAAATRKKGRAGTAGVGGVAGTSPPERDDAAALATAWGVATNQGTALAVPMVPGGLTPSGHPQRAVAPSPGGQGTGLGPAMPTAGDGTAEQDAEPRRQLNARKAPMRATSAQGKAARQLAEQRGEDLSYDGPDLGPVAALIARGGRAFVEAAKESLNDADAKRMYALPCLGNGQVRIRRSLIGGKGGRGYFPGVHHQDAGIVPYCGNILSAREAGHRPDRSYMVALKQVAGACVDGAGLASLFDGTADACGNLVPSEEWGRWVGLACMANQPAPGESPGAELVWTDPPGIAESAAGSSRLASGIPFPGIRINRFHWAAEEVTVGYGSHAPFRQEELDGEAVLRSTGQLRPQRKARNAGSAMLQLTDCVIGMEFRVLRCSTGPEEFVSPASGSDPHVQPVGAAAPSTWCTIVRHSAGMVVCRLPDPSPSESPHVKVSLLGKRADGLWLRPGGKQKRRRRPSPLGPGMHYVDDSAEQPMTVRPPGISLDDLDETGTPSLLGWVDAFQLRAWPPRGEDMDVSDSADDEEVEVQERGPGEGVGFTPPPHARGASWAQFSSWSSSERPGGGFRIGEALSRLADRLTLPDLPQSSEVIIGRSLLGMGPPHALSAPLRPLPAARGRSADVQALLQAHPDYLEKAPVSGPQRLELEMVQSLDFSQLVTRAQVPLFIIGRLKAVRAQPSCTMQDLMGQMHRYALRTLTASSSGHAWTHEGPLDYLMHLRIMGYGDSAVPGAPDVCLTWAQRAAEVSGVTPVMLRALVCQSVEYNAASLVAALCEMLIGPLPDQREEGSIALLGSGGGFWLLPFAWQMRKRGVQADLVLFAECHPAANAYATALYAHLTLVGFTSAKRTSIPPRVLRRVPRNFAWSHDSDIYESVQREGLHSQRVLISLCCGWVSKANRLGQLPLGAERIQELKAHHLREFALTFLVARQMTPLIVIVETTACLLRSNHDSTYRAILDILSEADEEGVRYDFRPLRINPAQCLKGYTERDRLFLVGLRVELAATDFGRPTMRATARCPTWPPHPNHSRQAEEGLQCVVDQLAAQIRGDPKPTSVREKYIGSIRVGRQYQATQLPPTPEEGVQDTEHVDSVIRQDGRRDGARVPTGRSEPELISSPSDHSSIDDYLVERESVAFQKKLMDSERVVRWCHFRERTREEESSSLTALGAFYGQPVPWLGAQLTTLEITVTNRELSKDHGELLEG